MRAVVITYKLTDEEYPTLNELPEEMLEYYISQGYLVLMGMSGGTYAIPEDEQSLNFPVAISIVG